jgi:diguanylate cyclase (GGDEF)-like protein
VDVSQLRTEFSVYYIDSDFATAESVLNVLKNAGYDARYFPTLDSALNVMAQLPPHIVVFNTEVYESDQLYDSTVDDYLQKVRDVSSEILVILLTSGKRVLRALQTIEKDLAFDYQARPFVSSLDLVQKIDRAAERLYFQFESEQLREALEQGNGVLTGANDTALATESQSATGFEAESGIKVEPLERFIAQMNAVKDLDQTVQAFLDAMSGQVGNAPALYFKYIPHYLSLVLSQSVWLPIEKIRGIGVELKSLDPARIPLAFRAPGDIHAVRELLKEAFKIERFAAFAHVNESEILGVFILFDPLKSEKERHVIEVFRGIFDLAYRRNWMLKERHTLEINDPVTGLFNRKYFRAKLDDEISRSRRLSMPLSMMIIDIDQFGRLNKEIGIMNADTILRMIAVLLKKTTRANDILARIGPDELVLLMPHTGHEGAAIKAERIRRIIEATRFPVLEGQANKTITVGIGVSEYPSFCNDAEGLLKSADEALLQVREAGGNRVCLSQTPPGFSPDFMPLQAQDVGRERQ